MACDCEVATCKRLRGVQFYITTCKPHKLFSHFFFLSEKEFVTVVWFTRRDIQLLLHVIIVYGSGLYSLERGAHNYWLGQGAVDGRGDGLVFIYVYVCVHVCTCMCVCVLVCVLVCVCVCTYIPHVCGHRWGWYGMRTRLLLCSILPVKHVASYMLSYQ
jgi:hypothetical protein